MIPVVFIHSAAASRKIGHRYPSTPSTHHIATHPRRRIPNHPGHALPRPCHPTPRLINIPQHQQIRRIANPQIQPIPRRRQPDRRARPRRHTLIQQLGIRLRARLVHPDAQARQRQRIRRAPRRKRIAYVIYPHHDIQAVRPDQARDGQGAPRTGPGGGRRHVQVTRGEADKADGEMVVADEGGEVAPLRVGEQREAGAVAQHDAFRGGERCPAGCAERLQHMPDERGPGRVEVVVEVEIEVEVEGAGAGDGPVDVGLGRGGRGLDVGRCAEDGDVGGVARQGGLDAAAVGGAELARADGVLREADELDVAEGLPLVLERDAGGDAGLVHCVVDLDKGAHGRHPGRDGLGQQPGAALAHVGRGELRFGLAGEGEGFGEGAGRREEMRILRGAVDEGLVEVDVWVGEGWEGQRGRLGVRV